MANIPVIARGQGQGIRDEGPVIHEANKATVPNPNVIRVGQVLTIPH